MQKTFTKSALAISLLYFALFSAAQDSVEENVEEHIAMYNRGFVEEAIAGLEAEKSAHPEAIEPSFCLGYVYGKLRMYRDAAREYRRCLDINPDLPEVHYNLGTVLNSQGDYENAALHFEEALLLDPDSADAMYNCGISYYNLGRYVDAVKIYKDAEKLDEDNKDIRFNLALTYEELDPVVALRMWETYSDEFGDDKSDDYYLTAQLHIEVLREKLKR
ncbi:MAG: tetratricopeptide repeat protein [bacterium]|nr:tetratricopeptide repeat protein [bacterium]